MKKICPYWSPVKANQQPTPEWERLIKKRFKKNAKIREFIEEMIGGPIPFRRLRRDSFTYANCGNCANSVQYAYFCPIMPKKNIGGKARAKAFNEAKEGKI